VPVHIFEWRNNAQVNAHVFDVIFMSKKLEIAKRQLSAQLF
jgi:hypothetical protein